MKAFNVSNNEGGVIVFHETRGRAKAWALGYVENFQGDEYTDLSARRERKADSFDNGKPRYLEFCEYSDKYFEWGWQCHTMGDCNVGECKFKSLSHSL